MRIQTRLLPILPSMVFRRRRYGGLAVRVHSHAGGREMTIKTKEGMEIAKSVNESRYDTAMAKIDTQKRIVRSNLLNDATIGEEIYGSNVSVNQNKLEVTYIDDIGNRITKTGGHKAWRMNNPGNLSFSSWEKAKESGAIGIYDDGLGHKYAIYSSEAKGMEALSNKLDEKRFSYYPNGDRRPIKNMIGDIYAPASDNNNPRAYVGLIASMGVNVNKTVSELTPQEKQMLMQAIYTMEGRKKGTIIKG